MDQYISTSCELCTEGGLMFTCPSLLQLSIIGIQVPIRAEGATGRRRQLTADDLICILVQWEVIVIEPEGILQLRAYFQEACGRHAWKPASSQWTVFNKNSIVIWNKMCITNRCATHRLLWRRLWMSNAMKSITVHQCKQDNVEVLFTVFLFSPQMSPAMCLVRYLCTSSTIR